jgi:hypothetical protein
MLTFNRFCKLCKVTLNLQGLTRIAKAYNDKTPQGILARCHQDAKLRVAKSYKNNYYTIINLVLYLSHYNHLIIIVVQ